MGSRLRLPLVVLVATAGLFTDPTIAGPIARPRLAWTTDGISICTAAHDQQRPVVIPDASGGAFIAWIDSRAGLYTSLPFLEIYAHHVTSQGDPASDWPVDGLLLSQRIQQDHLAMSPDGRGGFFIAWDSQSPYGPLTLRHVDGFSGVAGWWSLVGTVGYWPEAPLTCGGGPADINSLPDSRGSSPSSLKPHRGYSLPSLVADDSGGVFVALRRQDFFNGSTVTSQRLRAGCTVAPSWPPCYLDLTGHWSEPGIPATCSDGAGGAFVAWANWTGTPTSIDIRISRVGPVGVRPGWPMGGIVVCDAVGDQLAAGVCPDGQGGAFVIWQDGRSGSVEQTRMQRVLADGSIASGWPSEGILLSPYWTSAPFAAHNESLGAMSAIIADGLGGAVVAWIDYRDGPLGQSGRVCLQRVTPAGATGPGWTPDGLLFTGTIETQGSPAFAPDGLGGVIVAWQQMSAGGDWDIYAQRVDLHAGPAGIWGTSALPVCVQPGDQTTPFVASLVGGGAMIVWEDGRSGNRDIYAAKVGIDGVVPVLLSLVRAEAETDVVRLEWYASGTTALRLAVERRIESDWRALATMSPDGNGHLVYEDRDVVAGGRYGYRLSYVEAGVRHTTAETWVEVPAVPTLALALRPSPSAGPLVVSFTLANAEPAALEMFDLGGRRVYEADLGGLGRGSHVLVLDRVGTLAPGVYLIRLRQAGRVVTARGVVAR